MDNQKLAYMNTPAPVTNSMVQALDRYITHNLAERGWLSIDEDNQDLSSEILRNLLDLSHGLNSQRFILETLADNGTHFAMAKWISTIFLEGNLGPKDSSLLSFTDGVINFFHDLCQDQFAWSHTAIVGSQGVASGGPSSYTRTLPQTVGRTALLLHPPTSLYIKLTMMHLGNISLIQTPCGTSEHSLPGGSSRTELRPDADLHLPCPPPRQ